MFERSYDIQTSFRVRFSAGLSLSRIAVLAGFLSFFPPVAGAWPAASGLPDPALTPGAVNPAVTQANIHETICVRGYTRTIRPPVSYTEPLKRRQLREYGYSDQQIWRYEEDHLVPLEVGGAPRNPKNLWPEPHYGTWNSYRKDRLENEIHWRVCHGKMSLRRGQEIFEHNWEAGYRKYVAGRRREWPDDHRWSRDPRGSSR